MKISKLVIVLLLFASCNATTKKYEKIEFLNTVKLNGEQILENVIGARTLSIIGDTLLAVRTARDPFFSLFCFETHALVTTFGDRGMGPGDFLSPNIMRSLKDSTGQNHHLYIMDRGRRKIMEIDILKTILDNELVFKGMEDLPADQDFIHYFKLNNDERLCFNDLYELSIYNLTTEKYSSLNEKRIYRNYSVISEEAKRNFFFRTVTLNPEYPLLAVISDNIPQIDIYKIESRNNLSEIDFVNSVITDNMPKKISEKDILSGGIRVFNYSNCSNSNYIFLLNINQMDEYIQVKSKPISIQVIDWNGKAICNYLINEYINYITVDNANKYIYGIDYLQDKIFRYELTL